MPQRNRLICAVSGQPTEGVELTPGARSAIHPDVHKARESGEQVKTEKRVPPAPIRRRTAAEKAAALKKGK